MISHIVFDARLNRNLGWNALMNVSLALVPITIVGDLNLDRAKRIGLCILLGLGILCVSSDCPSLVFRRSDNACEEQVFVLQSKPPLLHR